MLNDEQKDVRDASAELRNNEVLKVIAFAGAGKTTTLVECAGARGRDKGLYIAFNKSIADEAARKFARTRCNARTMHSMAYRAMAQTQPNGWRPERHTARDLGESGIPRKVDVPRVKRWGGARVAMAALRTISNFCASDEGEIGNHHARKAIVDSVGEPELMKAPAARERAEEALAKLVDPVERMARLFWDKCRKEGRFTHDSYLKMLDLDADLRRSAMSGLDYLLADEAQDLNPVQRSILMKANLPLIAVGDPFQSIYSWRGAENSLEQMDGKTLHLTSSFRFGEEIAATARRILEARPDGGPSQRLKGVGPGPGSPDEAPQGAIICRTNAGVLDAAANLISQKPEISMHVDNIDALLEDVRSSRALHDRDTRQVTSQDIKRFDSWAEMKMEAEAGDANLTRLVKIIEERKDGEIEAVARRSTRYPEQANVAICTGHRSKGMEFPVVRMGPDWKDIGEMREKHQKAQKKSPQEVRTAEEEWNVLYVAATRAQRRLQNCDHLLEVKEKAPDPVVEAARPDRRSPSRPPRDTEDGMHRPQDVRRKPRTEVDPGISPEEDIHFG